MSKIKEFLKGKKTYIVAIVGVIVNGCAAMGYITPEVVDTVNTVLVFLGLGTVRAGIKKS